MRSIVPVILTIFILSACAAQNAMPLGNDMMRIDVSAAPIYGRAGAQRMAYEKAAKATLDAGYDKFIVMDNAAWTEKTSSGFANGGFSSGFGGSSGGFGGAFASHRRPESSLIIQMFHDGDKGSEKAIDARSVVAKKTY